MLATLQTIETGALIIATAIASVTLALWLVPALASFAPAGWSQMTGNTASGMLLSAASLAVNRWQCSPFRRRLGLALAALVLLLGVATALEYLAHISFGFDTLLPHQANNAFPGRPSPQTVLAFILLGICMLTLRQAKNLWSRIADISALALLALNFVVLGGKVFGALDLIGIGSQIVMSPQTLAASFCFSTVVMLRRAEQGDLLAVLVNLGIGSRMVRLILPAALLMPFALLAAEAYLVKSGWISEAYAQAIVASAAATLVLCIVTWSGWRINALERDLRDLSLTDDLTKVYNRRGFYFLGRQAILEAQRANSGLSLFFFDLDGLKHVNDLFGHETGSEMIKAFAEILNHTFRQSDIIGRVGGDEFAVITIRDEGLWITSISARLHQLADAHNSDASKGYRLSFSTGYAELHPGNIDSLDNLVIRADSLMYEDKAKKKKFAA